MTGDPGPAVSCGHWRCLVDDDTACPDYGRWQRARNPRAAWDQHYRNVHLTGDYPRGAARARAALDPRPPGSRS